MLFPTTHAVMHAAHILQDRGLPHDIIPRPKGLDADCGIAISIEPALREAATAALRSAGREPSQVVQHDRPATG